MSVRWIHQIYLHEPDDYVFHLFGCSQELENDQYIIKA